MEGTNPTNNENGAQPQDLTPATPNQPSAPAQPAVTANDNPFSSLQGEELGFVQNKGWKTVGDMLQSYRNLEKLRGVPENELLRLPQNPKQEDLQAIYKRLGAPDKYEDYGIEVKNEDDAPFVKNLLIAMQRAGLNKAQAKELNDTYETNLRSYLEELNNRIKARDTVQEQELDKMWGKDAVLNRELCRKVAAKLGFTEEQNVKMKEVFGGPKGQYEFLYKLSSLVNEDLGKGLSAPGSASLGIVTPDQARARRSVLMSDSDWVERYMNGSEECREEMRNLNKIIAGGK